MTFRIVYDTDEGTGEQYFIADSEEEAIGLLYDELEFFGHEGICVVEIEGE